MEIDLGTQCLFCLFPLLLKVPIHGYSLGGQRNNMSFPGESPKNVTSSMLFTGV